MAAERTAVALGLFDGVHLGHRAVLKLAAEQKKNGYVPIAFTFSPDTITVRKSKSGYIYGSNEKTELIKGCGIENVMSWDFDSLKNMKGDEFAKNILADKLNAAFVCCGNNFRFGKGAFCGAAELKSFGERFGFEVRTADDVVYEREIVSSTAIRNALLDGNAVKANRLLGNPYTIEKEAVHGAHLGSTIGFPTINQLFGEGQLVPKYGVYASEVYINGRYRAVTNIGIKPTVSYGGRPLAETHILDFSGDLYGKTISVRLRDFIRSERKFSSVDELKSQIAEDVRAALIVLA